MNEESSTQAPALLVMAAGMGSRYGGLKQLDAVGPNGETIIDYSVHDAIQAGFGKIVFIISKRIESEFKQTIGSRYDNKINVSYALQELNKLPDGYSVPANREKPWGTGQAILMAEELINEPFAVINADDFYGATSFKVLSDHLLTQDDNYCMVGFELKKTLSDHGTVARGICTVDDNNFLRNLVETLEIGQDGSQTVSATGPLTGNETTSMNMWGFNTSIFEHINKQFIDFLNNESENPKAEFYIPLVVNNLIDAGTKQVKVLATPDSWFGVTYKEDKVAVEMRIRELINNGTYPKILC